MVVAARAETHRMSAPTNQELLLDTRLVTHHLHLHGYGVHSTGPSPRYGPPLNASITHRRCGSAQGRRNESQ